MRSVRHLVDTLARDRAALHGLRHDPAALARSLNLSAAQADALRSADAFFKTEKPILDSPLQVSPTVGSQRIATAARFAAPAAPAPGLAASADTGTLLPGPDTGTYTISSSATATATVVVPPPAPAGPPPPAAPAVPGIPGVPGVPGIPGMPATPQAPVLPGYPAAPVTPPTPTPAPPAPVAPCQPSPPGARTEAPVCLPGSHPHQCGCQVAIAAQVANLATTAAAAIAAITASAGQPPMATGAHFHHGPGTTQCGRCP